MSWTAKILSGPPLIRPAQSYILPRPVPGEEDALARGSIWVELQRATGTALLQCAIGYQTGGVLTGIFRTPAPEIACIVAAGYAYRFPADAPETVEHLPLRPVVAAVEGSEAFVLAGFHTLLIVTAEDWWETPRLSHEGISQLRLENNTVHGLGWDLMEDEEVPFTVNLATRTCHGGGFHL